MTSAPGDADLAVEGLVTVGTECNQVLRGVMTKFTSRLDMMNLQICALARQFGLDRRNLATLPALDYGNGAVHCTLCQGVWFRRGIALCAVKKRATTSFSAQSARSSFLETRSNFSKEEFGATLNREHTK